MTRTDVAAGIEPNGIVTGDFDGDGDTDLATIDRSLRIVKIRRNSGDGVTYSNESVSLAAPPDDLAAGNFDGDGFPDLVVAGGGDFQVVVNGGPGGDSRLQLTARAPKGDAVFDYTSVAAIDVERDGFDDVAVAFDDPNQNAPGLGGYVDFYRLAGPGLHAFEATLDCGSGASDLASGDMNGDGHPDLVASSAIDSGIYWFANKTNGSRSLADAEFDTGTSQFTRVAIGDVTGDGRPDVLAVGYLDFGSFLGGFVDVFRNLGPGQASGRFAHEFGSPVGPTIAPVPASHPPLGVAVGDVNGDGALDVLVASADADRLFALAFRTTTGAGGAFVTMAPDGAFPFDGPDRAAGVVAAPLDAGTSTDVVVLGLAGTMSVFRGPAGGGGGGGEDLSIAPATGLAISTKSPPRDGQKWTFRVTQTDASARTVRVQSARTAGGPWEDLPSGAQMKAGKHGTDFSTKSLDVTSATGDGDLHFRTVSSAPGLRDGVAAPIGPFPVAAASPELSVALSARTTTDPSGPLAYEILDRTGLQTGPGELIEYSADVTNRGSGAAAELRIAVKVPKGTTFVSASDGAVPDAKGRITLNIASVQPGETRGRSFIVRVLGSAAPSSKITAGAAKVNAANAKGSSRSFTTRVRGPLSLRLDPKADDVDAGEDLRFVLEVRNTTTSEISAVRVDLPVPSGSTYLAAHFLDASGTSVVGQPVANPDGGSNPAFSRDLQGLPVPHVTYFLGNLAPDSRVLLAIDVRAVHDIAPGDAVVGGLYVATGTLGGKAVSSGTPGQVRVPVTDAVPAARPSLDVLQYANSARDLSPSGTVVAAHGEEFGILVITVNRGAGSAIRTRVNGEISTGAQFVPGSFELAGESLTGSTRLTTTAKGVWSVDLGTLGAGESAVVFFKARVRAEGSAGAVAGGNYLGMRTQASSDDFAAPVEAQPSPLRVLVPRPVQLHSRVVRTTHSDLAAGQTETITWEVRNSGQVAAASVVATLELPEGMTCTSATVRGAASTVTAKGGRLPVVTTPVGAVGVGETLDVSFDCRLDVLTARSGDLVKYLSVQGVEAGAGKAPAKKVATARVAASTGRTGPQDAALFVGVTAPYRVNKGFTHQCTVFLGNLSANVAGKVRVQLMIPPGVRVRDNGIGLGGRVVGNYVLWEIGDAKAHGTAAMAVLFDVPAAYPHDEIAYAAFIYADNAASRKTGIVRAFASKPNLLSQFGDGLAHIFRGFYAEVEQAGNPTARAEFEKFNSSSTVGAIGGTSVLATVDGLFLVNVGPDKALVLGPTSTLEWDAGDARLVSVGLPHDSVILMGSPDAFKATVTCFGQQTVRYVIDNALTGVECQEMSVLASGGRSLDATGGNYLTMRGAPIPVAAPVLGLGVVLTPNVHLAAGGGTLVAAGSLNLVNAGGMNVIGMNGASFVSDGTGRMTGTPTPESTGAGILKSGLVGQDGSTLVGQDGSTLVGQDGSTLVGQDGSTLVGNDGASIIGENSSGKR